MEIFIQVRVVLIYEKNLFNVLPFHRPWPNAEIFSSKCCLLKLRKVSEMFNFFSCHVVLRVVSLANRMSLLLSRDE